MDEKRVVDLLEGLHLDEEPWGQWCSRACQRASAVVSEGLGAGVWSVGWSGASSLASCFADHGGTPSRMAQEMMAVGAAFVTDSAFVTLYECLFPEEHRVVLASDMLPHLGTRSEHYCAMFRAMMRMLGASDVLGLTSRPTEDTGFVVCVPQPRGRAFRRRERQRLTQLSLHFEAAARVRLRPASVLGTLSPEGKLDLAGSLSAATRERLIHDVAFIDAARTRRRRDDGEGALDVWRALSDGHVSLVESYRFGKRLYLVCENRPSTRAIRALDSLESTVVLQASRGLANKAIAYSLGIAPSEVSRHLASARAKLGARDTADLVRGAAVLAANEPPPPSAVQLTSAEKSVLELVQRGMSNQEIAIHRGTSIRTVANQVAALLRKTAAAGRRQLLTLRSH